MSSKIKKQRRIERDKLKPHSFIGGYVKLPDFSPNLVVKQGLGKNFTISKTITPEQAANHIAHELSHVEERAKLPDDSPKSKALSQSRVLCQMHLNGDLSFAELFNGLLQVKNKLEREELAEIDSDYKESLKDSK